MDPRRCIPPVKPGVLCPGGVPGGGLFPFSNAAGAEIQPFIGPTPTPPESTSCHDTLTVVPFSVFEGAEIPVSGGGAALQSAITLAGPGTALVIEDSLDYSPITFTSKTDVTVRAAVGQTPSITATAGDTQHCVTLGASNNGIALKGLRFIGSGNAIAPSPPGQATQGLINFNNAAGGLRRLIVEDCAFEEPDATVTQGAPGIWLRGTTGSATQQNIWIHRCVFLNTAMSQTSANSSGYGALTIGGFSNVYIQNCWIRRTALTRGASPMRGVVVRAIDTIVEDVYCEDIGTGGECENFLVPLGSQFGTASGPISFRNCVSLNGRIGYATRVSGPTVLVENCVYYATQTGITNTAVYLNTVGSLTYQNSVSFGAGDGNAFTPNPLGSPIVENNNSIVDFASNGRTLSPTDVELNPLFEDPANGDYVSLNPSLQTIATDGGAAGIRYPGGEKIIYCNH